MKKLLTRLVTMVMALCLIGGLFCCRAWAAGNSFENARPLSIGKECTDSLMKSNETDYFRFKLSKKGYITVSFRHGYVGTDASCWKLSLYNNNQKRVMQLGTFAGDEENTVTTGRIGLAAGTYFIKVEKNDKNWSDIAYHLKVKSGESSSYETEGNSSFSQYDTVQTGKTYYGAIATSSDNDFFRVVLENRGRLTLTFGHSAADTGDSCWKATLYDKDHNAITQLGSYQGNAKKDVTSPKLGLAAGTYFIKVEKANSWSKLPYHFKLSFTKTSVWETEANNTIKQYDSVKTGTTYYGAIAASGDKDYYRVVLENRGRLSLTFGHEVTDNGASCWKASLCDKNGNLITQLGDYQGNAKNNVTSSKIGLAAGTYYIVVERSNWSSVPYHFKLNFTKTSVWETESNNATDTADTIQVGKSLHGAIWDSGDADYYKLTLTRTLTMKLVFAHDVADKNDGNNYWSVSIYDKNGNDIGMNYSVPGNNGSFTAENLHLNADTYYIRVKGYSSGWGWGWGWGQPGQMQSNYSTAPYTITLKAPLDTPAISSLTNTSSGIVLKWEKVKNASGYVVSRRVGSGQWQELPAITDGSTSYTDKDCTNGSKYQYRVAAFRSENYRLFSADSSAKSIYRLSRPTISSVKNGAAGKVTVKWKENSKATGYQIKYVTGDTTKTTTTTSLSKTLSGLTKGKTYKIYVRAYKTVSDTKYYSAYSAYKSIKVTK